MSAVVSPPRSRRRGVIGWLLVGVAMVAIVVIGAMASGAGWTERAPLDPASAGPPGARALTALLADQGIDVRVERKRAEALDALDSETTLVLPDAPFLSDAALEELVAAAGDVVLIEPRSRTLRLFLSGAAPAGSHDGGELAPDCDVETARRAGSITAGALTSGDDAIGCYPSGEGFALLTATEGGRTFSAIDGHAVFSNEALPKAGNAALALGLVGTSDRVVWYMPALADADVDVSPSLGELTPRWVTPVMLLLVATVAAAALWRGRRFGPLVVENLPVTVRASETTVGRAHLYAQSRDPAHALDQLRLGTIGRLAALSGLPAHAPAASVADAVAQRLGEDRQRVHDILVDSTPISDRELVEFAARLRKLEGRVRGAARPERNSP